MCMCMASQDLTTTIRGNYSETVVESLNINNRRASAANAPTGNEEFGAIWATENGPPFEVLPGEEHLLRKSRLEADIDSSQDNKPKVSAHNGEMFCRSSLVKLRNEEEEFRRWLRYPSTPRTHHETSKGSNAIDGTILSARNLAALLSPTNFQRILQSPLVDTPGGGSRKPPSPPVLRTMDYVFLMTLLAIHIVFCVWLWRFRSPQGPGARTQKSLRRDIALGTVFG